MARPPPQQSPDHAGGLPGARKRFHSELSIQGYKETEPNDDAALQKTGERTRRGPEPQTHSTCSQLCDGQNFGPHPGKKKSRLGNMARADEKICELENNSGQNIQFEA